MLEVSTQHMVLDLMCKKTTIILIDQNKWINGLLEKEYKKTS